jgi:hypothetical protein
MNTPDLHSPTAAHIIRGRFAVTRLAARLGMFGSATPGPTRIPSGDSQFHAVEAVLVNTLFWIVICSYTWAGIVCVVGETCIARIGSVFLAALLYPLVFQLLLLVAGSIHRVLAWAGIGANTRPSDLTGRILSILLTAAALFLIWPVSGFRFAAALWLAALCINASAFVIEMPFALIQSDSESR